MYLIWASSYIQVELFYNLFVLYLMYCTILLVESLYPLTIYAMLFLSLILLLLLNYYLFLLLLHRNWYIIINLYHQIVGK